MFSPGDWVLTPGGVGRVAYQRMAAPDYRQAEAVSVVLEARRDDAQYSGTIYRAADVRPICGASLSVFRRADVCCLAPGHEGGHKRAARSTS